MSAFSQSVSTCLSKYVTFSGRARRPEYWWFVLFVVIGSVLFIVVEGILFGAGLFCLAMFPSALTAGEIGDVLLFCVVDEILFGISLFSLSMFLPLLAAGWRRLHDTGRPGWYLLLPMAIATAMPIAIVVAMALGSIAAYSVARLLQLVVLIMMIWWMTRPTQEAENQYGPVPLP